MTRYLIVIVLILTVSCKNSTPARTDTTSVQTETATTEKKPEKLSSDTIPPSDTSKTMRLVIEFYSIGSGIDYNAMIAYEDSLGAYSGRIGKNIDYLKKPWGREGEHEFCLRLTELTPSEQNDFIKFTRSQLKSAKWVNIHENADCRH